MAAADAASSGAGGRDGKDCFPEDYYIALGVPPSIVQARLFQDAFYPFAFATTGIVLAITMNCRNSRAGFWLTALIVAVADVPFILFVLVPGYAPFCPASSGRRCGSQA